MKGHIIINVGNQKKILKSHGLLDFHVKPSGFNAILEKLKKKIVSSSAHFFFLSARSL